MRVYFWTILALLLDQINKRFVIAKHQALFWRGITFDAFENRGGAFSSGISNATSIVIASVFLTVVFFSIRKSSSYSIRLGLGLIFGGGISNLADRIFRGYVVDIASFGLVEMNLADLFIILGAIVIFMSFFMNRDTKDNFYDQKSLKVSESKQE